MVNSAFCCLELPTSLLHTESDVRRDEGECGGVFALGAHDPSCVVVSLSSKKTKLSLV